MCSVSKLKSQPVNPITWLDSWVMAHGHCSLMTWRELQFIASGHRDVIWVKSRVATPQPSDPSSSIVQAKKQNKSLPPPLTAPSQPATLESTLESHHIWCSPSQSPLLSDHPQGIAEQHGSKEGRNHAHTHIHTHAERQRLKKSEITHGSS